MNKKMVDFENLICCVKCKGNLTKNNDVLSCNTCKFEYIIKLGIPILLTEKI